MEPECQELPDGVMTAEFDFNRYWKHELTILIPNLQKLGYTNIHCKNGEVDSFGPMSRLICATDSAGSSCCFCYG